MGPEALQDLTPAHPPPPGLVLSRHLSLTVLQCPDLPFRPLPSTRLSPTPGAGMGWFPAWTALLTPPIQWSHLLILLVTDEMTSSFSLPQPHSQFISGPPMITSHTPVTLTVWHFNFKLDTYICMIFWRGVQCQLPSRDQKHSEDRQGLFCPLPYHQPLAWCWHREAHTRLWGE